MRLRRALIILLAGVLSLVTGCSVLPESKADESPSDLRELGASEVLRDQVYLQRATGPLKLDLFLPAPSPKRSPLVVYVHGGGWDAGYRTLDGAVAASGSTESSTAAALLSRGYAVATVDYRLTGAAKWPAQVEDVAEAVRWLQHRAGSWHLDPDRVGLWGASAGGLLVSQLGAVAGDPAKPGGGLDGVRAVVNWFGPTDMSPEAEAEHPKIGDYARRVVGQLLGCAPRECPAVANAASPVKNLSGDEPPFLIQQGIDDAIVPIDQSLDFADELRRRGVPVEMHPYDNVDHGFTPGIRTPMIARTVADFLGEHLES